MAIKFIPEDKGVTVEGNEAYDQQVLALLKCMVNKLNRLELQLEHLTDEQIDRDGDIL